MRTKTCRQRLKLVVAVEHGQAQDGSLAGMGEGAGTRDRSCWVSVRTRSGLKTRRRAFRLMDAAEDMCGRCRTRGVASDRETLSLGLLPGLR